MRALAKEEDLAIITADVAISRNPHEIEAWKEAGHTVFFLKPGWTHLALPAEK
jgi:PIN like domain